MRENPLHIEYRPKTFDEVLGNKGAVEGILSVLKDPSKAKNPHAFLLSGPSGCGKTTLARLIKDRLGCTDAEFYELNSANVRGIDDVREVIKNAKFPPLVGNVKVYLFDECHQLTGDAAEALLKVLEDTPKYAYFILCTTAPEKLKITLQNRCTKCKVEPLNEEMPFLLSRVLKKEGKTITNAVRDKIIEVGDGSPRQALVILEHVIDIPDEATQLKLVESYTGKTDVREICSMIKKKAGWTELSKKLQYLYEDPESVRAGILGWFGTVLLNSRGAEAERIEKIMAIFEPSHFNKRAGLIVGIYRASLL
jgi:DNA polymerase-3 subunit gamma/tau